MRRFPAATYLHAAVWTAAAASGLGAVFYARLIAQLQGHFFTAYGAHPWGVVLWIPAFFVFATFLVVRFAPDAKGSGIPQVLQAIEGKSGENAWKSPLISIRTAVVKILSSGMGILGGASIGREGPTVQVSASLFTWFGGKFRGLTPQIDLHSFLVMGAAAGVAAAFNTPLAGIAFAIEEISEGRIGHLKGPVMLGVILAGITAQALAGDYLYFGHPSVAIPLLVSIPPAIALGILGGFSGGAFAWLLGNPGFSRLPSRWWLRSALCGLAVAALVLCDGKLAGSGYEATRAWMDGDPSQMSWLFPFGKFVSTVLSYFSGMAGGIFSPCLSIGAGLGFAFGKVALNTQLQFCGLLGMVAFFSGAVQAPLTAVIIVMEMTNQHGVILALLISGVVSQAVARRLMPVPLYRHLAGLS